MNFPERILQTAFLLLLLLTSASVNGALPAFLGGQKLPSLAPMLEKTTPAVVNIATRGTQLVSGNSLLDDPFFRHFFDLPDSTRKKTTQSLGSGVIVDAKAGYIITNHHVIESADEITVTLSDGRELQATLMGVDPQVDLAVIQVQAEGLVALSWADSSLSRVGDFVVAIGNPFGLGQTVTSGIISALGRSGLGIEDFEDFIQTDASINPGNSGGALVDLSGRLLGINTAILGPSGGNVGIGFAIPSQLARQVLQHLIDYGEVRRGRLGISSQELTPELAAAFGIDDQRGVAIIDVATDSPAHKAGVRRGDVVIAVSGRQVKSTEDVRNIMGLMLVGQEVELDIIRGKKKMRVQMVVEEIDDRVRGESIDKKLKGLQLVNKVTRGGRPYVEIERVADGSAIAQYGFREGDIILSVNKLAVANISELREAVSRNRDEILLNIQRGRSAYFVLIQ